MRWSRSLAALTCLGCALASSAAFADGFWIHLENNKIVAECQDATVLDDRLHNGNLSPTQDLSGLLALIGGGINIPNDAFTMEVFGPLWYSNGGEATLAAAGVTMTADSYSTVMHTTLIGSGSWTSSTSGSSILPLTVDNSDNMIWKIPDTHIPAGVYGVKIVVHGLDEGNPQTPFESSDPLVITFRTPHFNDMNPNLLHTAQMNVFNAALAGLSPPVPGDFDGDGDVDGADFVAWQTNFPTAEDADLSMGDADGDGDVDGADFVVWQTHFPTVAGPGAALVPEPGGVAMALIAAGLLTAVRSAKRMFG